MLAFRERLDKAHVAMLYLLIVLGSSSAGRVVGLSVGVAAFVSFNVFFLPPYNTLVINDPLDWLVLVTFLVTSVVAAELINRQREQATLAERRRSELDQMATLGAETLNAARAEHALEAIARVIAGSVGVERCELFAGQPGNSVKRMADSAHTDQVDERLLSYVLESGRASLALSDGTVHVLGAGEAESTDALAAATSYAVPLRIRGVIVGVLRLSSHNEFRLSSEQRRVLNALSYYAALAIERLRLEATEELAEELRRVDRLKDSLLAAVSHDLRTPLTTIRALAHELSESSEGEQFERAVIIQTETDNLSTMVEGLLELSQLNARTVPVHAKLNTADELLEAALQRAAAALQTHEVKLHFANDWMLVGVFDMSLSLRILVNLLENAAKYSPDNSPIEIEVSQSTDLLSIAVCDRGRGIPEEDRARLFEPFFRARNATADVRGAGLGLSIAKQLAEVQRGSLSVSGRVGGGSVFTLSLPAGALP